MTEQPVIIETKIIFDDGHDAPAAGRWRAFADAYRSARARAPAAPAPAAMPPRPHSSLWPWFAALWLFR